MDTKSFRIAGGVALLAFGAPLPACAQFNYPMIIVPPPAQNYVVPKPAPKAPPEKPKSADKPADALNPGDVNQCYQGRPSNRVGERLEEIGELGVAMLLNELRHAVPPTTAARLANDSERRPADVGQGERAVSRHGPSAPRRRFSGRPPRPRG